VNRKEIDGISRGKTTGLQRDDNGNVNGKKNGNGEEEREEGVYTPMAIERVRKELKRKGLLELHGAKECGRD